MYIAELNGNAWMHLINPDTGGRRKRFNPCSRFIQPVYKSLQHQAINAPCPIIVSVNGGQTANGTIMRIKQHTERRQLHLETGEMAEFNTTRVFEIIEFKLNHQPHYVELNVMFVNDEVNEAEENFILFASQLHRPYEHTPRMQRRPIDAVQWFDDKIDIIMTEPQLMDEIEWDDLAAFDEVDEDEVEVEPEWANDVEVEPEWAIENAAFQHAQQEQMMWMDEHEDEVDAHYKMLDEMDEEQDDPDYSDEYYDRFN